MNGPNDKPNTNTTTNPNFANCKTEKVVDLSLSPSQKKILVMKSN